MVSSTITDLTPDRQAVVDALAPADLFDVRGPVPLDNVAVGSSSYLATVGLARSCDLLVLILGASFGFEFQDGTSATQVEFEEASRDDPTKILVFRKRSATTEAK